MLADVADQRPTAHQLLRDFFPHTSLQNAQTNATSLSFGASSPLTTQPSQPNPAAVQSPKVHPNQQPGIRRKGSVKSAKSVDERQKKGHTRGGSSQNTPSQSAGIPKRTPSRRQRSRSKSIRKAKEIRVLGMA
ncbi:hypothetical protein F5882DRAFT_439141 [Hyaloscypha sp. PMI_1271]|nr:hypothetical protein F5882DRAFT_439141 [Hyaloscypha sp. PMI_1271]